MRQPSKVTKDSWIWASYESYIVEESEGAPETGKWLLFIAPADIDRVWASIRDAVYAGTLTWSAKSATAKPNPNASSDKFVICVYTKDAGKHATLVPERLRKLGFVHWIPWKSDFATRSGIYENRGFRKISKRYE